MVERLELEKDEREVTIDVEFLYSMILFNLKVQMLAILKVRFHVQVLCYCWISCFNEMSLSNCDKDDKRQSPSVCVPVRILTVSACYAPTCTLKVRVSLAVTTISSTQPVLDYNGILDFRILGRTGLTDANSILRQRRVVYGGIICIMDPVSSAR